MTAPREVKDPALWTADEIVAVIPKVLHDAEAVAALVRLLAVRDPHRAQEVIDTIQLVMLIADQRAGVGE